MNKYIIKNCEQIHSSDNFCWSKNILCQDCTDCVMKQIYKLCKDDYVQFGDKELRYDTLENIIKLLDIQEVE